MNKEDLRSMGFAKKFFKTLDLQGKLEYIEVLATGMRLNGYSEERVNNFMKKLQED